MKRLAAFAAACALIAAPCHADEFCDIFLSVIHDAPGAFKHVRGEPYYPGIPRYDHVVSLPGIADSDFQRSACSVFPNRGRRTLYRYFCGFPFVRDTQQYRPVAQRMRSCLKAAHKAYREQPLQPFEKLRWSLDEADIVIGFDIPNDAEGLQYYLYIDQKPA